ncbi:putative serine/threonine-protein kinase iks1 [Tilletia horrida]|nr:putative serine/threonine-protein kinase iks1 [Tilletia horrida]
MPAATLIPLRAQRVALAVEKIIPPSRATSRPGTPIVALVADDDVYHDDEEDEGLVSDDAVESANAIRLDDQVAIEAELRRKAASRRVADGPVGVGIPGTPPQHRTGRPGRSSTLPNQGPSKRQRLQASQFSQGYFERFFVKVRKLGRGARGTVWLCQHVLAGQQLGEYAVKQVPVGDYADNLLASLKEVQMLETLRHPNVIHYQHAWIEEAQMSRFSPRVPTLHVLQVPGPNGLRDQSDLDQPAPTSQGAAEPSSNHARRLLIGAGGQLPGHSSDFVPSGPPSPRLQEQRAKNERLKDAIRAQRIRRRMDSVDDQSPFNDDAGASGAEVALGEALPQSAGAQGLAHLRPSPAPPQAQHLLGEEELYSLLRDMASGLGWLHDRGVLHLDVKPENVLLHWEQADDMLPRAMLSDFGSSTFLQGNWRRIRSGHTGTMDFMAPEAIFPDPITGQLQELTSKSDIWSLGMILHLCVFFRLPYRNSDDIDQLRAEMEAYPGYSAEEARSMHRARVPQTVSLLLSRMLDRNPSHRPTCAEILAMLDAAPPTTRHADAGGLNGPEGATASNGAQGAGTRLGAATSYLASSALTLRNRTRRGRAGPHPASSHAEGPALDGHLAPLPPLSLPPSSAPQAGWPTRVIRGLLGGRAEPDRGPVEPWWLIMLIIAEVRTIVLLQWVVEGSSGGSGGGGIGAIRSGGRAITTVGLVEVVLM